MEKEEYDRRQKYIWDNKNVAEYELKEAVKEAREEALEQGKLEGKEEGAYNTTIEIAHRMKQNNFSAEQIAEITGLTTDEIEHLF